MKHKSTLLLVISLLCASIPVLSSAAQSGLHGQVRLRIYSGYWLGEQVGPPGCIINPPITAEVPLEATIGVYDPRAHRRVTRFRTDQNGNYSIKLSPGTYILIPEPVYFGSYPIWSAYVAPLEVQQIKPREYARCDIVYSGATIPSAYPEFTLPDDGGDIAPFERQESKAPGSRHKPITR